MPDARVDLKTADTLPTELQRSVLHDEPYIQYLSAYFRDTGQLALRKIYNYAMKNQRPTAEDNSFIIIA